MELPAATDAVSCGAVWLSPEEMCELRVRGKPVHLSATSMRVLAYLITAGGRVVGREELSAQMNGGRGRAASRAMDVRIFRIRRALGPLGRYLLTVPGRGYRVDVTGLSLTG